MGDTRSPVYLWNWSSESGGSEMDARGFGGEVGQESQNLRVDAAFSEGQWSVQFTRALTTDDEGDLQFLTSAAIPMAFFAWDGDNGEYDHRSAVSSWYFLALEEAPPVTVYIAPALALALTALMGMFAVARAQKREREHGARAVRGIRARIFTSEKGCEAAGSLAAQGRTPWRRPEETGLFRGRSEQRGRLEIRRVSFRSDSAQAQRVGPA